MEKFIYLKSKKNKIFSMVLEKENGKSTGVVETTTGEVIVIKKNKVLYKVIKGENRHKCIIFVCKMIKDKLLSISKKEFEKERK